MKSLLAFTLVFVKNTENMASTLSQRGFSCPKLNDFSWGGWREGLANQENGQSALINKTET